MPGSGWVNWFMLLALAFTGGWAGVPVALELPVCAIQGSASSSPYVSREVSTSGVVTLDLDQTSRKGFFIQADNCDSDPSTSDGVFVYVGEQLEVVRLGDRVQVSGVVREYFGRTEIHTSPLWITILAMDQPMPEPAQLSPPFDSLLSFAYYEARESMLSAIPQAIVVGPTGDQDTAWLIDAALGEARIFWFDPRGFGELIQLDGSGLFAVEPQVRVPDKITNLHGVVDYRQGSYRLLPVENPVVLQSVLPPVPPPRFTGVGIAAATFNMAGLYDTLDDPWADDDVWTAAEYQRGLQKRALAVHEWLLEPDLLALQGVENQDVLEDLLSRPELQYYYEALWFDGPDAAGLDVALLYRPEHAAVLQARSRQGCTSLIDGLGPDGNGDVEEPANGLTCDLDGDGLPEGNRLFSHPPLLAQLRLSGDELQPVIESENDPALWVVVVHLESRAEDVPGTLYTQPRRLEQVNFITGLLAELRASDPSANVIVLGDFSDAPASPAVQTLLDAGLEFLVPSQAVDQHYSLIEGGISEFTDCVLVDLSPGMSAGELYIAHINSDYPVIFEQVADIPYRSSDHDPLLFSLHLMAKKVYLPMLTGSGEG